MKKYAIGIDLGGTYTKLALVDKSGRLFHRAKLSTTDYDTKEALLKAISYKIKRILKKGHINSRDLRGIGIGVPGPVDFKRGLIYYLTNVPGWKNVRLKKDLEARFKVPVLIDNDVNLMALGEHRFGAGRGARNLVCITLGTGVGGGIIIDGRLYRGSSSVAGEIGHMPLRETGQRCNCGSFGCFERYVSNSFIVGEIKRRIKAGEHTSIKRLVNGNLSLVTPEVVSYASKRNDKLAIALWQEIGKRVGIVLSGVINLLNPEKVIIGGGLANAGKFLFEAIRDTVTERTLPIHKRTVKIIKAKLGADAGIVGAAALFL